MLEHGKGLYLVVLCGEPDVGFVSWFRSWKGRFGRAISATAAVRAVPQARYTVVYFPELPI